MGPVLYVMECCMGYTNPTRKQNPYPTGHPTEKTNIVKPSPRRALKIAFKVMRATCTNLHQLLACRETGRLPYVLVFTKVQNATV